jgi:hypothetical protein
MFFRRAPIGHVSSVSSPSCASDKVLSSDFPRANQRHHIVPACVRQADGLNGQRQVHFGKPLGKIQIAKRDPDN